MVPPTEPCALRSTQPLKVSTRDFSWGKGGRCFWLTTYHSCSAATSRKSGGLNLPGTPWATSACRGTPLLYFYPSFTLWNSGLEVRTHAFFTSSLDRGELLPRPVRFTPGKETGGYSCVGTGLDKVMERNCMSQSRTEPRFYSRPAGGLVD